MTNGITLEEQLERAERGLYCAQMIDDFSRMQAETSRFRRQIASIKKQIAERDERAHLEGACAAMGDRYAG